MSIPKTIPPALPSDLAAPIPPASTLTLPIPSLIPSWTFPPTTSSPSSMSSIPNDLPSASPPSSSSPSPTDDNPSIPIFRCPTALPTLLPGSPAACAASTRHLPAFQACCADAPILGVAGACFMSCVAVAGAADLGGDVPVSAGDGSSSSGSSSSSSSSSSGSILDRLRECLVAEIGKEEGFAGNAAAAVSCGDGAGGGGAGNGTATGTRTGAASASGPGTGSVSVGASETGGAAAPGLRVGFGRGIVGVWLGVWVLGMVVGGAGGGVFAV